MSRLSIIVPVYNNHDSLRAVYNEIKNELDAASDFEYELVMIDDGSQDDSWLVMKELAASDSNLKIIQLSRNFGSHAAMLCGLVNSTGDCAVIKSADLQEPTEIILRMFQSWQKGNSVVLATRESREDSGFFPTLYYYLVQKAVLPQMPKDGFDIFLVDRKVIEVLERMDEKNSAITAQILWLGFTTDTVPYVRLARKVGKSQWTLQKKFRLATDTFFSFSNLPFKFLFAIGGISVLGAIIWGLAIIVLKLLDQIPITGWATLSVLILLSFGIIMLSLGIIGAYLWRTFDAVRNRPLYIIQQKEASRSPNSSAFLQDK
jgi:dolichol-phosphate mannosyltransferase